MFSCASCRFIILLDFWPWFFFHSLCFDMSVYRRKIYPKSTNSWVIAFVYVSRVFLCGIFGLFFMSTVFGRSLCISSVNKRARHAHNLPSAQYSLQIEQSTAAAFRISFFFLSGFPKKNKRLQSLEFVRVNVVWLHLKYGLLFFFFAPFHPKFIVV